MNDTENVQNLINERNNQNKRIEQLVLEIERLNNITSKLEKWLKENAEKDTYSSIIFGVVLNYFQELKEDNNGR